MTKPLPPALIAMMQIAAAGRAGPEELLQLREHAPRFVDMLRAGLNTDLVTLVRTAEEGRLTTDKIAEAMR